jgi:hypothetical protein
MIHNGFIKAAEYLDLTSSFRAAYAAGLIDGILLAPMFDGPDGSQRLTSMKRCVTSGMTDVQVAGIIEKFVRDHPKNWHQSVHVEAYKAMLAACQVLPNRHRKQLLQAHGVRHRINGSGVLAWR